MNNPNSCPFKSEDDDDNDTLPTSVDQGPAIVNATHFNFLLNAQKQQHETEDIEHEKSEDDDTDESDEETPAAPGTRRTRAARLYRSLMKRSEARPAVAAAELLIAEENIQTNDDSQEATTEDIRDEDFELPESTTTTESDSVSEASSESQPEDDEPTESLAAVVAPAPQTPNIATTPRVNANQLLPQPVVPAAANTAPTNPPVPPAVPPPLMGMAGNPNAFTAPAATANVLPPVIAPANTAANHTTTIIDRRGGLGAPLAAFLAANYFSRRRHRRTKKETKKIRTDLAETQTKQRTESQRLSRVEKVAARTAERPIVAPVPRIRAEINQSTEIVSQPVTLAEAIAVAPITKEVVAKQIHSSENNVLTLPVEKIISPPETEQLKAATAEAFVPNHIRAKERVEKPSESFTMSLEAPKSIDKDTKEVTFDRRYEVKDAKAPKSTPIAHQSLTAAPTPVVSPIAPKVQAAENSSPSVAPTPSSTSSQSAATSTDLYKQSVQTGVMLGLVVIIIGAMGYMLTR